MIALWASSTSSSHHKTPARELRSHIPQLGRLEDVFDTTKIRLGVIFLYTNIAVAL